jgi:predicted O-linked N-acetylglucosamine transferase (SPINDLY family)
MSNDIEKNPDSVEINSLIALFNHSKFKEAAVLAKILTERFPLYGFGWKLLGAAYREMGQFQNALPYMEKAIALLPNDAGAHFNLGVNLNDLGKLELAVGSYRRALEINPNFSGAHNNLGIVLKKMGRSNEAEASYLAALAIKSDFAQAYNNLGNINKDRGQIAEAEKNFRSAIQYKQDYADAYYNLGITLIGVQRYEESTDCFKKVLSLKPDYLFATSFYLYSKMQCCNWEGIEEDFKSLCCGIDTGQKMSVPFPLLAIPSSPKQQQSCAEFWVRKNHSDCLNAATYNFNYSHDRIRVGYFSSDFYNHATAHLMLELLSQHDRTRFEIIGFSFGISPNDKMRQRVSTAFDRFIDVNEQSDQSIVDLARKFEIDIAVDLKGHTTNPRTGIFALRAAPIQVNYLGYPGTMGAPFIDYLIADATLIPVEDRQYYTEKIAYLPDSYQVNDSQKLISSRQFTRQELGLPEEGFVFCCFNNNYKITPVVFDIWMQLLEQVDGSVLWLLETNVLARTNLIREAAKAGISSERIIFAKQMDLSEHLARHRLADLFLDTFYYNAHTTASDALWAGLPVLTCLGETFAGRVAASLLKAIGLPELITYAHNEYQSLALELATNLEKLASIRQKLDRNRITYPLFNTELFARSIEDSYTQMWKRHQASLLPEHIFINSEANKANLKEIKMKVIFIAGSYGSGTSAITGALDKMGVSTLPPHFSTNDAQTPNSFESLAFRALVNSFADETNLKVDKNKEAKFIADVKKLIQEADGGAANAVVLKMPLASICITQLIEALDPFVILVHRPFSEIEASRMRRNWPAIYGAMGAEVIYSTLYRELTNMKKSYLALSYHDLQENPRLEILRVTNFCDLTAINNKIEGGVTFIRGDK